MVRLIILATIAFVGLSLACSPARAEEPQKASPKPTIEKAQESVAPLPTTTRRVRISTRDRWRGAPYLRSTDETLRSHALDVALPSANPAFQGGASLQPGIFVSDIDSLRKEALDIALPPANPAFAGGGTVSGGTGF